MKKRNNILKQNIISELKALVIKKLIKGFDFNEAELLKNLWLGHAILNKTAFYALNKSTQEKALPEALQLFKLQDEIKEFEDICKSEFFGKSKTKTKRKSIHRR